MKNFILQCKKKGADAQIGGQAFDIFPKGDNLMAIIFEEYTIFFATFVNKVKFGVTININTIHIGNHI